MATAIFSPAQIERFKRKAKQLCRATPGLSHSAALDHIAAQYDYTNWSILHKHSDSNAKNPASRINLITPSAFLFERTSEEMRLARRTLPQSRDYFAPPRVDEARSLTEDISSKFISAENIVDYAISYISSLLELPRFYIYPASRANWEMRCWLPYGVIPIDPYGKYPEKQILVNRRYKPVGQMTDDQVDYETHINAHLQLDEAQLSNLASWNCKDGFLYYDGSSPWRSRQNAENYLVRLKILQVMLKTN